MESVVNKLFAGTFKQRKVLITGHTGFKGSWLMLWLKEMGADVLGYSLAPESEPNHYQLMGDSTGSTYADIRDRTALNKIISDFQPEVIFHLAAQAIVRRSYDDPIHNWDTNLSGTLNLLEAARHCSSIKVIVAITTDKVYENKEQVTGYQEHDSLGGYDPYSASKAACEILIQSHRRSYFQKVGVGLSSARAGNVIGGGDWSNDRLIPDVMKSSNSNRVTQIRSPNSVRPWQHVLDSLSGYLLLCQKMLQDPEKYSGAWNFGPDQSACIKVIDVLNSAQKMYPQVTWQVVSEAAKHETQLLNLNSQKAHEQLNWKPVWDFSTSLRHTIAWYREYYERNQVESSRQLISYISDAKSKQVAWTIN